MLPRISSPSAEPTLSSLRFPFPFLIARSSWLVRRSRRRRCILDHLCR